MLACWIHVSLEPGTQTTLNKKAKLKARPQVSRKKENGVRFGSVFESLPVFGNERADQRIFSASYKSFAVSSLYDNCLCWFVVCVYQVQIEGRPRVREPDTEQGRTFLFSWMLKSVRLVIWTDAESAYLARVPAPLPSRTRKKKTKLLFKASCSKTPSGSFCSRSSGSLLLWLIELMGKFKSWNFSFCPTLCDAI